MFIENEASALGCDPSPFNPVTDVAWGCIFPIRIGGVAQIGGNDASDSDGEGNNPLCVCSRSGQTGIGLRVTLWDPAAIIDTVVDPWCMNFIGVNLAGENQANLAGKHDQSGLTAKLFQQSHYYIYPAWKILDMFTDVNCMQESEFDIALMTELLPTWQNDLMAILTNPEAVLFANPVATLSCIADSQASTFGSPLNALFYCMGGWGQSYPLAGTITARDAAIGSAGLAARTIFLMGRSGMLKDTQPDGCSYRYAPIWTKSHYKFQMLKPTRESVCHNIGQPGALWASYKKSAAQSDNFSWMVFRKVTCCVSIYEF